MRDAQASAEVAALLASLRADHPARIAFSAGRPTAELSHLVPREMVAELMATHDRFIERIHGATRRGPPGITPEKFEG